MVLVDEYLTSIHSQISMSVKLVLTTAMSMPLVTILLEVFCALVIEDTLEMESLAVSCHFLAVCELRQFVY